MNKGAGQGRSSSVQIEDQGLSTCDLKPTIDTPHVGFSAGPVPPMTRFHGTSADESSNAKMALEIRWAWVLLAISVIGSLLFVGDSIIGIGDQIQENRLRSTVELSLFTGVLFFLLFGNFVYQLTRLGYLRRRGAHLQASTSELAALLAREDPPSLTILVPSYKEELHVVAQTLLSSGLQQYRKKRIVLLIDDPPTAQSEGDREALDEMRLLPAEMANLMSMPARRIRLRQLEFLARAEGGRLCPSAEAKELSSLWRWIGHWYFRQADGYRVSDHTDRFFVEHVLRAPGRQAIQRACEVERLELDECELTAEYRRLTGIFDVEFTSFERKRYVNLSHERNKAMNLNSYIGLLGSSFREVESSDGLRLEPTTADDADLVVPSADYLLTLDADSLLAPDYALRLIFEMERPCNHSVAVIQTPYCAVPGAASAVERIAGATTDIQHILHQGSTHYAATFWVGANAVLRKKALDGIRTVVLERGFPVTRYIQDRTVIEDTESSIDLVRSGWLLHNYPDRLSVSATPPDFGSLIIQRGRWANGGLIILPKLLRHMFSRPISIVKLREGMVRFHYLTSIASANLGLLIVLCYPFAKELQLASPWLPLAALPYFVVYARDLTHSGYLKSDVIRVYALNLALLPVNLAGVFRSIHQAVTNKKLPFARTPKVSGRTGVPARYLSAQVVILGYWLMASGFDLAGARWSHASFGLMNVFLMGYGIIRFVGLRGAAHDLARPAKRLASMWR